MLQIENASIAYGNDILFSGFNLQLERGEIASISGPSGCGKSSLLNAILGFTPLKEGRIVLNGILLDKGNVDVVRKQTAWIPQELALPLEWVKDMVQLPFGLKANRGTPFSETRLFACFCILFFFIFCLFWYGTRVILQTGERNIRRPTPTDDDSRSLNDWQTTDHCR